MNLPEIQRAVEILKSGGVVVLPTETVYGLACDALNPEAVLRVFTIKARPSDNPLIVHVDRFERVAEIAQNVPPEAARLAERFWPGPLTMVLQKAPRVPDVTTGGLDTVAVRVPNHPLTLEVLKASGLALAAPSANVFTELSPTSVEDLSDAVRAGADLVLDGGPCAVGVESTVLDLTEVPARILRPGAITAEDLASCGIEAVKSDGSGLRRSPGRYPRHYAPRTPVILVASIPEGAGGLCFGLPENPTQIQMPSDPSGYRRELYRALHRLDRLRLGAVYVEVPPQGPEWEAVQDRLLKASSAPG